MELYGADTHSGGQAAADCDQAYYHGITWRTGTGYGETIGPRVSEPNRTRGLRLGRQPERRFWRLASEAMRS